MFGIAEKFVTITNAGGNYTIPATDQFSLYLFSGTATLAAPYVVTADTPTRTTQYTIFYNGAVTTAGANVVSFFGTTLTADQALRGKLIIIATYKLAAPDIGWKVVVLPGTGWNDSVAIPVSFEAGEQCGNKWVAPCNGTIVKLDSFVTKAIAGTDNGTITAAIAGVGVTNGVVTVDMSSALDVQDSATPTALNTFTAGQIISLTTAKVTAGGKCLVTLKYLRTP